MTPSELQNEIERIQKLFFDAMTATATRDPGQRQAAALFILAARKAAELRTTAGAVVDVMPAVNRLNEAEIPIYRAMANAVNALALSVDE